MLKEPSQSAPHGLAYIRFEGTARDRGARPQVPPPAPPVVALHDEPTPVTGLPASILEAAGLDPGAYRVAPLKRRMAACLRAIRVDTEARAIDRVQSDHTIADVALNTVLIGVSEFFRDPSVFHALRTTVISAFQRHPRPLRILSVGSSSGAELYSVAMLLAEASILDSAHLVGIDCRPDAISQARAGTFSEASLAGVHPRLRSRYLEPAPHGWRVVERIRSRTAWHIVDATRECPSGPWDMVLCRNFSIYLWPRVADAMFLRIHRELISGGVLVVGKAERPPRQLNFTARGRCIYTAHGD